MPRSRRTAEGLASRGKRHLRSRATSVLEHRESKRSFHSSQRTPFCTSVPRSYMSCHAKAALTKRTNLTIRGPAAKERSRNEVLIAARWQN